MIRALCCCVLFMIFIPTSSFAADESLKTFTVLPFTAHGPDKYQYLSKGIQSMLTSRLTWEGRFEPHGTSGHDYSSQDVTSAQAGQNILEELGADFLIWGSVTIAGDQASLDYSGLSADRRLTNLSRSTSIANLVPELENVSDELTAKLFNAQKEQAEPPPESDDSLQAKQGLNPSLMYTEGNDQPENALNPAFRYQEKMEDQGRWRSQTLPFAATGLVVGDADNDGKNEHFMILGNEVRAYGHKEHKLQHLATYETATRNKCLNINMADLNKDGLAEIIVSAVEITPRGVQQRVRSFILNYEAGEFKVKDKNIDLFLNLVKIPPEYMTVLVGQRMGRQGLFARAGVHEVVPASGDYELGRSLRLPTSANVFNFAYLPVQDEHSKLIVADRRDHLRVYSHDLELQHSTSDAYVNSAVSLQEENVSIGLEKHYEDPNRFYYIPIRMISSDLEKDRVHELVVGRNISVAADFFPRYRFFPQGEIHSLIWDGVGLELKWKTRTIKGMVVDYGLADADNDGRQDLYVMINTHPGIAGVQKRRTRVLTYDLETGASGAVAK